MIKNVFEKPNKQEEKEQIVIILKDRKLQLSFQELYNNIKDLLFYDVSQTTPIIENVY